MDKKERKEKVVEVLNKARAMELFAITQYMIQHYSLDAMDYGELARDMKLIAIDEMRHAEQFAERINELDGDPVTSYSDQVVRGQEVGVIFSADADLEDLTIDVYNDFLKVCREVGDNVSAKLFETIIDEEQEHFNHFDNVSNHIAKLGDVYLSKIAGTSASTGPSTKGFTIGAAE